MRKNNVYIEALKVLEARGWCKGEREDEEGRVCILGALGIAKSGSPLANPLHDLAGPLLFNDAPDTTYEDVQTFLGFCAAGALE